ncbi:MAG: transposase [Mariprofundaceae bacterium]|nr:transposase [Mariprofundaceae bacterium]
MNNPNQWETALRTIPTVTSQTNAQPQRKSIRLKGYDYSQAGAYFITICTKNRVHLFGEIINGEMMPNDAGVMLENQWVGLQQRFHTIQLHEYSVMPNHFHGIITIQRATTRVAPTLGDMVGAFKSLSTYAYIQGVKQSGWARFQQTLWQRNYWEHIIRNAQVFEKISQYIRNNPAQWQYDQLNSRRGNPCGCPNHQEEWMT